MFPPLMRCGLAAFVSSCALVLPMQLAQASTTITNTRAEVDQMAALWETDTVAISPLANAQYPQYSGNWDYIFANSSVSADGDVHVNMAIDAAGTGKNGNNGGTASPIVAEVINATSSQLNYLDANAGANAEARGIFRLYTEHAGERHFEIHPITQLLRWNGSSFALDTDYHSNIVYVADGTTHAASTYTSLLDGSETMTASVGADNLNVTFTYPSPSVNYVQYDGVVIAALAGDAVSSYFLFQPNLVPNAVVRCRLIANTSAASTAAGLVSGQPVTVNALTRTDMAAVSDQLANMLAGDTSTFPRPVEFITLDLINLGAAAVTTAPTNASNTQATMNGTVNPNGVATSAYFQFGTTTSYGNSTGAQSLGSGNSSVNVSQLVTGLQSNTTYHYRIVATNSIGTSYGADRTFTTSQSAVPTITTEPATNVTKTSATLNALVNPNAFATSMHFELGRTNSYGTSTTTLNIGSGTADVAVSANFANLRQSTTYHFRVVATNANGTVNGPDQTFTTTPRAPIVTTTAATSVTQNSATLNGTVNPGALSTTYYFEYGSSTSYGTTTATASAGSGSADVTVTAALAAVLQPATTYHFRVVATNSKGTTDGNDQVFTTLPLAPSAATSGATSVGYGNATLNGTVNLNGGSGSAWFEYGTSSTYGSTTPAQAIAAGNAAMAISANVGSLLANTTYHFRAVGMNATGTAYGADQTFTTTQSAPPDAQTNAAANVGLTSAVLNGMVTSNSSPTSIRFEYGTTNTYGTATAWESIGSDAVSATFSGVVTGLMPNTLYHFRLVAVNGSGTTVGADQTFTTGAAQALFTYTFSDVTSSSGRSSAGGTANNVTFSSFTAVGVSANSGASGRFSFTNWPLGATNGSDTFTGTIDPAKYYEMTMTPATGFTLDATSITFTTQRSSTGVRQYSVRGGANSFAQNLTATVSPANANLSVVSTPAPNIFQVTDASTSANTGSMVLLDTNYATLNANTPATIRFYGFNAEGTSGTFSVDDVTIYGGVAAGNPPQLSSISTSAPTTSSAMANATINPGGAAATVYILYGTDALYSSQTASQLVPSGSSPAAFAQWIGNLRSYTTYHYAIVAANSIGITVSADQTFTTASGDRDGDGMPDDWEVQHGLNPDNASDAATDADGDGYTNLQEYLAGTDPRDANSALRIVDTAMDVDGFEISFTSVAGKKYRVESTDTLPATSWTVVADNVVGTGATMRVIDDSAATAAQRFYRVMLLR
jgi:hypothetical protein